MRPDIPCDGSYIMTTSKYLHVMILMIAREDQTGIVVMATAS